jgi:hypothetical protein
MKTWKKGAIIGAIWGILAALLYQAVPHFLVSEIWDYGIEGIISLVVLQPITALTNIILFILVLPASLSEVIVVVLDISHIGDLASILVYYSLSILLGIGILQPISKRVIA